MSVQQRVQFFIRESQQVRVGQQSPNLRAKRLFCLGCRRSCRSLARDAGTSSKTKVYDPLFAQREIRVANRVKVDAQVFGQFTHRWQFIPGLRISALHLVFHLRRYLLVQGTMVFLVDEYEHPAPKLLYML